ncbi:MAG: hypothetical protein AAF527_01440 [Pseudomonadota bacterium]
MEAVTAWLLSGQAIWIALLVLAAEAAYFATRRPAAPVWRIAATVAPGLCLMLAVRSGLRTEALALGFWLTAAFAAHMVDLRARPFPQQ